MVSHQRPIIRVNNLPFHHILSVTPTLYHCQGSLLSPLSVVILFIYGVLEECYLPKSKIKIGITKSSLSYYLAQCPVLPPPPLCNLFITNQSDVCSPPSLPPLLIILRQLSHLSHKCHKNYTRLEQLYLFLFSDRIVFYQR